jgi:hypothetical protein
MKSFYSSLPKLIATMLVVIIVQVSEAGTRYKDIVFSSVKVTKDIQFGSAPAISGTNSALYLDFYEPADDTVKLRPLVICIHGGSLISGVKDEMDSFCTDFAKRGYAAATIDYRIGIESPKGVKTILEALLRGVQDAKAAVRFFHLKANDYGIDTSKIFLEGSSAGSMIAVHYAYWNENEIPPDVDQAKWGDIEGNSGNPGYSTEIKGIMNYCGAIENPSWINAGEVPVGNFHGLLDQVVPPDSGVSTDFGIKLFGGVAVYRTALQHGIYTQGAFFPLMGHGGNEDSLRVFSSNFFYSLMVLSSSNPQDFASMELSSKSLKIFRYDSYTFETSAIDKNGNNIILPASMVEYSCDSRIGAVTSYGLFTPGDHPDSGYVYAKFNNTTDSCFVKTYDLKYFIISPKSAVTDTIRNLKINIDAYDADSVKHDVAITKFKLTSTNPAVGIIDSMGNFSGKMSGTTYIIASYNNYSDTCIIQVESASGVVIFDALENLNGWTFSGDNLDSLSVTLASDQKSEGSSSFKIYYKFTYSSQKSYYVYLNKDIPVFGIPDSIYLDVKSDGRKHKLFYRFSDANSGVFRASGKKYLDDSSTFDRINAPMSGFVQLSGNSQLTYPLTLNRIEIQLAGTNTQGAETSGTIYVDNLRLKYPGNVTSVDENALSPGQFSLEQNYPNPFNPTTIIGYRIPQESFVQIKIYDILGREIATLVNEEKSAGTYKFEFSGRDGNGKALSSGVYFYRIQAAPANKLAGIFVSTKKFILLK